MTDQKPINVINSVIDRAAAKKTDEMAKRLDRNVKNAQSQFFSIMASKIIGATAAPNLGKSTPSWQPLDSRYTTYRLKKFNIARGRFYEFQSRRGNEQNLKDLLATVRASSVFGTPTVTVQRTRAGGKTRNRIVIDLFPKVIEDIMTGVIDAKLFESTQPADRLAPSELERHCSSADLSTVHAVVAED